MRVGRRVAAARSANIRMVQVVTASACCARARPVGGRSEPRRLTRRPEHPRGLADLLGQAVKYPCDRLSLVRLHRQPLGDRDRPQGGGSHPAGTVTRGDHRRQPGHRAERRDRRPVQPQRGAQDAPRQQGGAARQAQARGDQARQEADEEEPECDALHQGSDPHRAPYECRPGARLSRGQERGLQGERSVQRPQRGHDPVPRRKDLPPRPRRVRPQEGGRPDQGGARGPEGGGGVAGARVGGDPGAPQPGGQSARRPRRPRSRRPARGR